MYNNNKSMTCAVPVLLPALLFACLLFVYLWKEQEQQLFLNDLITLWVQSTVWNKAPLSKFQTRE